MDPITMAAIAVGSQIAKGVSQYGYARKLNKFANRLKEKGGTMVSDAYAGLDQYKVSDALKQSQQMALNQYYDNSVAAAMRANADQAAGNVASQIKRSATTSGQAAAGALAAEQMRMQGYNTAALTGAQNRAAALGAVMTANQGIANAENMAYQYNELMPFSLKYERGLNLENQGLAGRLEAMKARASAFGDIMNGVSSTAMSIGGAYGTGTGFDMKGLFGKG